MNNYCMTLPSYTIGERAYEDIYRFCSPFGKTAVMIGGKTALSVASEKIIANCGGISVSAKIWYGGESSYENVEILSGVDEVKSADMIFAVGGGKRLLYRRRDNVPPRRQLYRAVFLRERPCARFYRH